MNDMKRKGFLQTACTLTAALLLAAACSQNDFDDKQGEPLPEGKYPMTFATTVEGVTATRATTDNTWAGNEEVAVQVGSGTPKKYTPATGGTSVTLQAATGETPFYWESTSNINVSAWYCGTGYSATPPTGTSWSWSVQSKQNEKDGYQKSDFLYAPARSIAFNPQAGTNNSLTFYHQTAKVIINIRKEGILTDASKITSVVIGNNSNIALKGTYTAPTGNGTAGTWTPAADGKGTITPKTLTNPNTGVSFGSGSTAETALASYEALVIPQTVTTRTNFIGITVDGTTYYYKAETGKNTLSGGYVHTYNITVKRTGLEVTVSNSSMSWGTGVTGSGSVELLYKFDLSNGSVTIIDDGDYHLTGTGSDGVGVTINGSPTVTLKDVTLTNAGINITGGSPTLIIQGENTLGGSIMLSKGANVTIKGNDADNKNNILNINGCINGSDGKDSNEITIEGITAEITGARWRPGIGKCNKIKISNSIITEVSGADACAAIGAGLAETCGDIEIINSDITATGSNNFAISSAAIGCGGCYNGTYAECGSITITLMKDQTKEQFEAKLGIYKGAEKVGLGGFDGGNIVGKVGTIIWKSADGKVIETINARDIPKSQ